MPETEETPKRGVTPEEQSVIDQIADLLDMLSRWVRQEARDIVRSKLIIPLQRLGLTVASAYAAGCLLVVGVIFLEVAGLMFLGEWLSYKFAFLLLGTVTLLGSAIFLAIKIRLMQK